MPTRAWRVSHGHAWNLGDTIVSGIGQGFIEVTPLQLAIYVVPHCQRALGAAAPDP